MKSRIGFAITLAGAVLCALPNLAMAQSGQNGDSQGGQAAPIEGTWIFSIHRVNTNINFTALQSFTAGGVTLATGTIDRMPPQVSPLYGSWRQLDDNSYVLTINLFLFDPTTGTTAIAMAKTIETIRLTDYNTLTGTGTAFSCDPNGDSNTCSIVPALAISFTGKRVIAGSID